jgi:hypothetical protein
MAQVGNGTSRRHWCPVRFGGGPDGVGGKFKSPTPPPFTLPLVGHQELCSVQGFSIFLYSLSTRTKTTTNPVVRSAASCNITT